MLEVTELSLEQIEPEATEDMVTVPELPYLLIDDVAFDAELTDLLDNEIGLPVYYFSGKSYNLLGYMAPTVDKINKLKFLYVGVKYFLKSGLVYDFSVAEHYFPFITL